MGGCVGVRDAFRMCQTLPRRMCRMLGRHGGVAEMHCGLRVCAETERSDPRRRTRTVPTSDLGLRLEKAITSMQSVAWSLCVDPWGRDKVGIVELVQPGTPCRHAQHGALHNSGLSECVSPTIDTRKLT